MTSFISKAPHMEIKYTQIFINNEWHKAGNGKTFPVINPSTGEEICRVEGGTKSDIDKAVEAARNAFRVDSAWRKLEPSARGTLMRKFAELLRRDIAYLAQLETLNNGKTLINSKIDIMGSAACIDYYAGWADKFTGETIPSTPDTNYPILMLALKLGPALACGNVVILKPAEETPLTALYCASLIKEAGFPPGVVNIVPGDGPECGHAIVVHEGIDKISFTGSVEVSQWIKTKIKLQLLLCGKSPLIICEDADVDFAVYVAHEAIFHNAAQNCIAGSRTFVHSKIYPEFIAKSVALAKKRIVGDPFDPNTQQGPQINSQQFKKILNYIELGKNAGARLECGGQKAYDKGYFIQPAVFSDVKDDMIIAREEIFGPVMCVLKFDSYDEVIERANATNFGLVAGVITKDLTRALKFVQELQAGSVWVNTYAAMKFQAPFGGFKQSGQGRELGKYGLEPYYEVKTVVMKLLSKI
ncbi:unnamed protein product [Rotaria magnacalcarata]|uniref:aldehyde dehydrogenase (NAD(+)) n=1 Tax=Rotaria magnacalcarata TaxID=392030 RepID=A0A816A3G3_9BILA|nr:unnamed protein product [Rotaria magnacalcarata]CAF4321070.1 unnamed protein product [Rotaria magnacalcarata]